jgi:hypothetical protein
MASGAIREPGGLAEPRRVGANVAALALILALVAGALIWQKPWVEEAPPAVPIPADARVLLSDQFDALNRADTEAEFARAAGSGPAARTFAADVWDARRRLGITTVRLDYKRGGTAADRADGSTSVVVSVRWASWSDSPWGRMTATEVPVRFRAVPRRGGFDIVAAESEGRQPLPPWLAGRAAVHAAGHASVLTLDGGSPKVDAVPLAREAFDTVSRLWPGATPRLTVIVPRTRAGAAALLGDNAAGVRQLAAVTTPIGDGGSAVVINPSEWVTMDQRAQQVVMTHEAVHVMTGTVGRPVNKLVAEGFADYIALLGDKRPLSVTAGQILRRVKTSGAPKELPSSADFDESVEGLGAVYESAWLLFRMLGDEFGSEAVIGFYRSVLDGAPVETAAQQGFGLTIDELTTQWRAYLTKSASTVS